MHEASKAADRRFGLLVAFIGDAEGSEGSWMEFIGGFQWRRALRAVPSCVLAVVSACVISACQQSEAGRAAQERQPEQAGQPVNPYAIAGHIAGARANMVLGDSRAAQKHVEAPAHDFSRSIRLPDATRPIDHEAARAAVRTLPGVRTAIWLDRANLAVMVDGAPHRSMQTIDQVCLALEPLGDTLAVVVNVQDVTARDADGATTLSRNCQLAEGQRALMQAKREVDVVSPEVRGRFKVQTRKNADKTAARLRRNSNEDDDPMRVQVTQ